jgi:hypothetical protein
VSSPTQFASLLTVLLLAQMGWAQSPESAAASGPATIRVDSQLVLLDAVVENKKSGQAVDTFSAKDFQLAEDGAPQTITYCSRDQLPLSVVLLFDMTETVHAALEPLARAAMETLGHLKPEDEVAVMICKTLRRIARRRRMPSRLRRGWPMWRGPSSMRICLKPWTRR